MGLAVSAVVQGIKQLRLKSSICFAHDVNWEADRIQYTFYNRNIMVFKDLILQIRAEPKTWVTNSDEI